MNKFIVFALIILHSAGCARKSISPLYKISNNDELAPYTTGYADSAGKVIIPIGKYIYCFTDTFTLIAIISPKEGGYYAINRNEEILFGIPATDNGPDLGSEGILRIITNGQYGLANLSGKIILKPKFNFINPLKYGFAAICIGGHSQKSGEYTSIAGGKWGFIDKKGSVIVKPIYEEVRDVNQQGIARVKLNGSWSEIKVK
jgi:hypothetical protein